ncbi:MAG: helix-turn-helix domain-containing protein [Steroidobacteraceae bacterium]
MQTASSVLPPLLDLARIAADERARVWSSRAPELFPGLAIRRLPYRPQLGELKQVPLGSGSLWYIHSPPASLQYAPPGPGAAQAPSFSIVLQLSGALLVSQSGRECALEAGSMSLIDERFGFRLEGGGVCEIVVLRMPRAAVLSSRPHLAHRTACPLPRGAGTELLCDTVRSAVRVGPELVADQRVSLLAAIIQMLGLVDTTERAANDAAWRIQAALAHIELELADPGLTASAVAAAQSISRRRLDALFQSALGVPVAAQIWTRRLALAAELLGDARRASDTIAQIAHAAGFDDASHFTHAFSRRYGCSPRQFRARSELALAHAARSSQPDVDE